MVDSGSSFEHDKFIQYESLLILFFFVFFTGRTGTVYGGNKIDEYTRKTDAINAYYELFLEKTGNQWNEKEIFKNYPINIIHWKLIMVNIQIMIKCKNYLIVQI